MLTLTPWCCATFKTQSTSTDILYFVHMSRRLPTTIPGRNDVTGFDGRPLCNDLSILSGPDRVGEGS